MIPLFCRESLTIIIPRDIIMAGGFNFPAEKNSAVISLSTNYNPSIKFGLHFELIAIRPKKKNTLFLVTWLKKIGQVGQIFFVQFVKGSYADSDWSSSSVSCWVPLTLTFSIVRQVPTARGRFFFRFFFFSTSKKNCRVGG